MKGYWGDPEATQRVLTRDGWLKSGDAGMLDADGFLYIKDRSVPILIASFTTDLSNQLKISLFEGEKTSCVVHIYIRWISFNQHLQDSVSVENALYADPRILEAAAVGVPDPRLGELVVGVVTVKPAFQGRVSEASLMAIARKRLVFDKLAGTELICIRLPRFAVPVMIIVRDKPFGKTFSSVYLPNFS